MEPHDVREIVLPRPIGTAMAKQNLLLNSHSHLFRILLQMLVGDWTSNRWVTVFTDLAEQMLGKSSQDIGDALEFNKDEAEQIFSAINFKSYVFKLRTKVEFYGDSSRNKTTAVAANPVNHKEYNAYLIKNIQEMTGISKH